jgi:carboxyvinyl-carboxyphosphonate phosphorylmutase
VLTLSELAEQVRRIARAAQLPLLVDGDHGYGNALNVRRTVEELEASGAAAVTIEDTSLPAAFAERFPRLISPGELAAKVRAAVDARSDPKFVIVGRTSARLVSDQSELLGRLVACQDSGAGAVFLIGIKSLPELDALASVARVPLILGAPLPDVSNAHLSARNVRLCLGGHQAYFDSVGAYFQRLQRQRSGVDPAVTDAKALTQRLSRDDLYARWAEKYLN